MKALFFAALMAGLFVSFYPGSRSVLLWRLPRRLSSWVNDKDDIINIAAFFVLASIALRVKWRARGTAGTCGHGIAAFLAGRAGTLGALMLLVCGIELMQTFIPERVGELQDVCTAWSGIFSAWLLFVVRGAQDRRPEP